MFIIEYAEGVAEDLVELRPFGRAQVLDRIDEQLAHQPTTESRNTKSVIGLVPPWEHGQPVWELRIGEFRVFFDVNEQAARVIVRAVRRQPPYATTEDIP